MFFEHEKDKTCLVKEKVIKFQFKFGTGFKTHFGSQNQFKVNLVVDWSDEVSMFGGQGIKWAPFKTNFGGRVITVFIWIDIKTKKHKVKL